VSPIGWRLYGHTIANEECAIAKQEAILIDKIAIDEGDFADDYHPQREHEWSYGWADCAKWSELVEHYGIKCVAEHTFGHTPDAIDRVKEELERERLGY
jgi:hypothetical protein